MRQRLEWLDALRGFTMLMVVTNHVYGMSFATNTKYSMFMSLCLLFRMPLFFFISGFLAWRPAFTWQPGQTASLVAKKFRVQVIPTLVFMTAYIALSGRHFWPTMETSWASPMKAGYWFTLVLLEMFLIYYALCYLCSRIERLRPGVTSWVLAGVWAVALFAFCTLYMPGIFSWYKAEWAQWTSITEVARFFQFFLLGNLCSRHWNGVQRLLDSRWFFPLLIAVAFLGAGDYLRWHNLRLYWANLPRTLAMYSLVLITVAFFRHYRDWFSKDSRVGAALQYIGVRTLDVYLLHYFFLPKLPSVGKWFTSNSHNFVLEGTAAFALAVLVVAFALLTSHVLRVSPLLKKWLFGREDRRPQPLPPATLPDSPAPNPEPLTCGQQPAH